MRGMTIMKNLDWEDVKTFRQVARHRTVRAAAEALGIHHSTVSRRIEHLEDAAQVRLFDRRPEGYLLTPAGEELLRVAKRFADDLMKVGRHISGADDELRGVVTVTMVEPLAEIAFAPRLSEFVDTYPGLEIHLVTTNDFLDVSRREADIAIRMDNNPPQALVGKKLMRYRDTVYASPDYLETVDLASTPERGRWLSWDRDDDPFPEWTQATEFGKVPTWGYFPELRMQQAAARNGVGLAMLPCLVGDYDPGLVRATDRPPIEARDIWILTHSDLRRTARVRAFMSFAEIILKELKPSILGNAPD